MNFWIAVALYAGAGLMIGRGIGSTDGTLVVAGLVLWIVTLFYRVRGLQQHHFE